MSPPIKLSTGSGKTKSASPQVPANRIRKIKVAPGSEIKKIAAILNTQSNAVISSPKEVRTEKQQPRALDSKDPPSIGEMTRKAYLTLTERRESLQKAYDQITTVTLLIPDVKSALKEPIELLEAEIKAIGDDMKKLNRVKSRPNLASIHGIKPEAIVALASSVSAGNTEATSDEAEQPDQAPIDDDDEDLFGDAEAESLPGKTNEEPKPKSDARMSARAPQNLRSKDGELKFRKKPSPSSGGGKRKRGDVLEQPNKRTAIEGRNKVAPSGGCNLF